ncbi:DUF962 domain-containing protein [bacterium]|nr:DUF962 domain-containing protein [bacterium]
MKSAVEQLSTYKSLHLNPTNIKTHLFGVTVIVWSVLVLLSLVRLPIAGVTLAQLFFVAGMAYYCAMHLKLGLAMIVVEGLLLVTAHHFAATVPYAGWIAVGVFVVGWTFQFIGHHHEKAKPAFMDDLNQLMIGPFFLMAEVFWMLGWEKPLEDEVTPIAVEKRRAFERAQDTQTA